MKYLNRFSIFSLLALIAVSFSSCNEEDPTVKETINFQNILLEPNNYWNGSDESGGITIGVATFNNSYIADWDYWEGFALSNKMDMTTSGYENQYSAFILDGGNYQNIYAVSYVWEESSAISFSSTVNPVSMKITNTTWAYLAMLNGEGYSRKFEQDDWFKLTIKGYDESDQEKGSIDFYLSDYRTTPHYIINTWTKVDLSSLVDVDKLVFFLSSTDNGDWGMNTPAFFCMDDLTVEYEK